MFCWVFARSQCLTESRYILFPPATQNQAPPGSRVSALYGSLLPAPAVLRLLPLWPTRFFAVTE
jgi:hypothetical protein